MSSRATWAKRPPKRGISVHEDVDVGLAQDVRNLSIQKKQASRVQIVYQKMVLTVGARLWEALIRVRYLRGFSCASRRLWLPGP